MFGYCPESGNKYLVFQIQKLLDRQHANMQVEDYETIFSRPKNPAIRITNDTGYGTIYRLVRRFMPKGIHFTVKCDESIPRLDEGGDVTIIEVVSLIS